MGEPAPVGSRKQPLHLYTHCDGQVSVGHLLGAAAFRPFAFLQAELVELLCQGNFYKTLSAAIHYVLKPFPSAQAVPGGTVPSGDIISFQCLLESSLLP